MRKRLTTLLALLGALAWSGLLFGIGLDDLAGGLRSTGVFLSIVLTGMIIAGLLYAIWRLVGARVVQRLVRR